MIRALIFDLDNTVISTPTISPTVFKELFALMDKYESEIGADELEKAKIELSGKAFQGIAEKYKFNEDLKAKGTEVLRAASYQYSITSFADYRYVLDMAVDKYLVTMGFEKLQQSKIDMLDVKDSFKETFVNDPDTSEKTKKDIFQSILDQHQYQPNEVLVIGDDPESEIQAAKDLGIPSLLYDPHDVCDEKAADYKIHNYQELQWVIDQLN